MTPLPVALRVVLGFGLLAGLLGQFVIAPPAGLWLGLLGWLTVAVVLVVGFVRTAQQRRRD